MYSVYTLNMDDNSEIHDRDFDTYDEALAYANSIKTEPVYYQPDPDGVYVLIYDDNHDSPRYTSW
jgi:hypothetical protein